MIKLLELVQLFAKYVRLSLDWVSHILSHTVTSPSLIIRYQSVSNLEIGGNILVGYSDLDVKQTFCARI